MKLMPASRAAWMMRIDSSWSGSPQVPNIIAPRHSLLTETPVRPRGRWSMRCSLVSRAAQRAGRGSAVGAWRGGVLVVADVAAPGDGAAGVVVLLHGDVDHQSVGRGAVPVVFAGLEEDAVAGADDLDGAAFALAESDAFGDVDRLAVRVDVPGGAGARCE